MKRTISIYLLGLASVYSITPLLAMEQMNIEAIHSSSQNVADKSVSAERLNKLQILTSLKEKLTCRQCGEVGAVEKKYCDVHFYCSDCISNNTKNTCPVCSILGQYKKENRKYVSNVEKVAFWRNPMDAIIYIVIAVN